MQEAKSEAEINDILTTNEFAVLDFWAPWCGPCKAMMPTLQKLSGEITNVAFVKVNVDDSAFDGLLSKCSIKAVPTLLFFGRGELLETSTGVKTEGALRELIAKLTS